MGGPTLEALKSLGIILDMHFNVNYQYDALTKRVHNFGCVKPAVVRTGRGDDFTSVFSVVETDTGILYLVLLT